MKKGPGKLLLTFAHLVAFCKGVWGPVETNILAPYNILAGDFSCYRSLYLLRTILFFHSHFHFCGVSFPHAHFNLELYFLSSGAQFYFQILLHLPWENRWNLVLSIGNITLTGLLLQGNMGAIWKEKVEQRERKSRLKERKNNFK